MQFTIVSVLLFAIGTQACALYEDCLCTNADGTANDTITDVACQKQTEPHKETGYWNGDQVCHFNGQFNSGFLDMEYNGLNNCRFRVSCKEAGATGKDSKCMNKVASV